MKTFTVSDIRNWDPCYDPKQWLPEDWRGTAVDILNMNKIPFTDRLWCILRTELISKRVMRLFAVWAYRDTLNWVKNPDPRSIAAADVVEKFALGQATEKERSAARSAAESAAAESTAESAAESAAWSAAWSARSAAWSAARSAAWSAASSAAWAAAWSASSAASSAASAASAASSAASAASSTAWSASSAARSAARSAAETRQRDKLIEMILADERDNL